MMLADLPPSSCATRLTVSAASLATLTPAVVDPVNDTMSISGWAAIASPTVGPSPLTRLKTPAGIPASWTISANTDRLAADVSGSHPLLELVVRQHARGFLEMKQRNRRLTLGRKRDRGTHL